MKKICLILIVLTIACILVSCNADAIDFIDLDTFSYNGSTYKRVDDIDEFEIYFITDVEAASMVGATRNDSKFVGFNLFLGTIYIPWEDIFGDNILRVYSPFSNIVYYFKEGFEITKHDELVLDKIIILRELGDARVIEFAEGDEINWNDLIDSKTVIKANPQDKKYWLFGETREYSNNLYIGVYYTVIIDDVVYISSDTRTLSTYCKVADEYQQAFKDAINNCNK